MNRKESIVNILEEFENEILINYWNEYANEACPDDYIYGNDSYTIEELFSDIDSVLRAVFYGNYRYPDDYFIINAYGNLVSFDSYDAKSHIDFDLLADYIMENGCREISEVWYEDIIADFIDYAYEKVDDREFTEEEVDGFDLVTEDWDDVIEEIIGRK